MRPPRSIACSVAVAAPAGWLSPHKLSPRLSPRHALPSRATGACGRSAWAEAEAEAAAETAAEAATEAEAEAAAEAAVAAAEKEEEDKGKVAAEAEEVVELPPRVRSKGCA